MIRVSIVEDDPKMEWTIREYVGRYVKKNSRNIETKSFSDGDEIAADYKSDFDIILMDIQMQFMDGLTAARHIRERDSEVVIIFIANMGSVCDSWI